MSTAVDKLDTKWTQWFPPPIVAEYDQCSLVVILALHRQVTVTKKVCKKSLSIIQRKRQPNGRLRRGGSQVSGSGQFVQRDASSTLGRLEHNLRVALSRAPCRSNGGDQFRRSLCHRWFLQQDDDTADPVRQDRRVLPKSDLAERHL